MVVSVWKPGRLIELVGFMGMDFRIHEKEVPGFLPPGNCVWAIPC
jgi:hypothetical protein